ncbi:MAG TPA: Hsp20/alpha crystallin family protein [Deltaproteobacteria bacterium]|nr:Hsp20/alpha crystallin family protein [Deltaproteobacteria bacterium]
MEVIDMLRTSRSLYGWNPWREMDRLENEMGNIFSGISSGRSVKFPPINVFSSEDDVVITSEIPGIDPADIDLTVIGDALTIKGNRKPQELAEGQTWHRRERGTGSFYRSVTLPFNVDGTKVEADYVKGVLKVTLPRAEADKPKKITIKTV